MLKELRICNFALLDELSMELFPGLNVLTGETGAGKSILLDAVSFLLGERSGEFAVREGENRARVEGIVDISRCPDVQRKLSERDLSGDDPGELHLSRELRPGGRTVYRINGSPCPWSYYREVGESLVDLHGQHEHQSLLYPARHRYLLDRFAGNETMSLAREVSQLYAALRQKEKELARMETEERERLRQIDRLRYEAHEIDQAHLSCDEMEKLKAERALLANADRILANLHEAYTNFEEGDDSLSSRLSKVERIFSQLARIEENQSTLVESLQDVSVRLQEISREVRARLDSVEVNPQRLEQVEERLDQLRTLMKKYGDSFDEVTVYRGEIEEKLIELEDVQSLQGNHKREREMIESKLVEFACSLSHARAAAATKLADKVKRELKALEMKAADFMVKVESQRGSGEERASGIGPSGLDKVEFLISTNPGESLKPLGDVASGGELSRIMLALKSIFAAVDDIPVLIFDEIDAGLGGCTADAVAARMRELAKYSQVLCVTHLPIIAAAADVQYYLYKEVHGGRTRIRARRVVGEERERELARMLAGGRVTPTTLAQARELLTVNS